MKQVSVLVGAGSIGQAIIPARRAGTPDEVGDLAEFLMSSRGRFISGADLLIDGGCTASYWYGDLQYLKTTH
jgi:NAD(P)-dependent dehydrogenase (short-subunit alcohol dehydrogenase family)